MKNVFYMGLQGKSKRRGELEGGAKNVGKGGGGQGVQCTY